MTHKLRKMLTHINHLQRELEQRLKEYREAYAETTNRRKP